ncbi:MAG: glutamine synthetase, partial [Acetobacteraceae bacterium]
MLREELIFAGTCDISGHVRGKAFPAQALPSRLHRGVGWTHSNLMMSAFGPIFDTPFGTGGDLMIVPDPAAAARVDFEDGTPPEHFILGDIRNPDESAWECCPRAFLRRGEAALAAHGLHLIAAFEQEFVLSAADEFPGAAYALSAVRRQGRFAETLIAALRAAGCEPDSFLAEYGQRQFEITVAPAPALAAADRAVIAREMARATAWRLGGRAGFSPMPAPGGAGSGVHIHMSLCDAAGAPVTHAPGEPYGLSAPARAFCAGLLAHMPALCAITAPCPVSYLRLTPNRWAPTEVNIVMQDRGAALRVCPVFAAESPEAVARQFNVEFRVGDAAASPYLALGALLFAGADGLRRRLDLPPPESAAPPLPGSLGAALDALEASGAAAAWFGPVFLDAYLRHKRAEIAHVGEADPAALCARYAEV